MMKLYLPNLTPIILFRHIIYAAFNPSDRGTGTNGCCHLFTVSPLPLLMIYRAELVGKVTVRNLPSQRAPCKVCDLSNSQVHERLGSENAPQSKVATAVASKKKSTPRAIGWKRSQPFSFFPLQWENNALYFFCVFFSLARLCCAQSVNPFRAASDP